MTIKKVLIKDHVITAINTTPLKQLRNVLYLHKRKKLCEAKEQKNLRHLFPLLSSSTLKSKNALFLEIKIRKYICSQILLGLSALRFRQNYLVKP